MRDCSHRWRKLESGSALERGFTLIEIVIVISLVAFVYSIAMPNLGLTSDSEIATTLGRVNSDFRAAYDLAVLSGKNYRFVFHLRSGDYWLESTDSPDVKLGSEKKESDPTEDEEKAKEQEFNSRFEEYERLLGDAVSLPDSDKKIAPSSPVLRARERLRGPQWSKVEALEWSKRSLGNGLIIKDMQAEHHIRKISVEEDGPDARAFIYVFPTGYIEKAFLHIYYAKGEGMIDDQKEPYTIRTNSWEGTSEIENGYTEVSLESDG
jgi:prepilin-type N-terminal cleavage/methylation domain-containing protein